MTAGALQEQVRRELQVPDAFDAAHADADAEARLETTKSESAVV